MTSSTIFRRARVVIHSVVLAQVLTGPPVLAEESKQAPLRETANETGEGGEGEADLERRMREIEAELEELRSELRDRGASTHDHDQAPAGDGTGREVQVGVGSLRIGGLLQFWYLNSQIDGKEFRTRRAEIALSGEIIDTVGYSVMVDVAKEITDETDLIIGGAPVTVLSPVDDDKILQDAFLSFRLIPHHAIHVGQKHVPIGMEGLALSGELDFPERTILGGASVAGVRGYGDVRDIGVQVAGRWPLIEYTVGVFNGDGPNTSDANERKDIGERVVFTPMSWLHLGVSRYDGTTGAGNATRQRTGAELAILGESFFLKSEYGRGRDGGTRSRGWYVSSGYRVDGLDAFGVPFDLMGAVRFEAFDPDQDVTGNTIDAPTVGLTCFLDDHHAKVQLSYSHYDLDGRDDDLLLVAFQVAF